MGNFLFFSAGIIQYFNESNAAGQIIVVLLCVFSLIAWTVMLGKWSDLKELSRLNKIAEHKIAKSFDVVEFADGNRSLAGPYGKVLKEAAAALERANSGGGDSAEMLAIKMGHVENAIGRAVANQSQLYESKMVLLGSIISGAPFLGLLGTVWGVMDSFGAMGMEGATATLQTLAPGVSGALLTTVAGLVVAIPSVFGYNFLLSISRGMVLSLENFASSLADKIELEERAKFSKKRVYKPETHGNSKLNADSYAKEESSRGGALRFDLNLESEEE